MTNNKRKNSFSDESEEGDAFTFNQVLVAGVTLKNENANSPSSSTDSKIVLGTRERDTPTEISFINGINTSLNEPNKRKSPPERDDEVPASVGKSHLSLLLQTLTYYLSNLLFSLESLF